MIYFCLMNEDFLKDKDVKFRTLFGQPCVEVTDKDKTFRYLSNGIDIDKLKKIIDKKEVKTIYKEDYSKIIYFVILA